MRMVDNERNQKRLEYLIDEAFDDIEIVQIAEEQKIEFSAEHNKRIKSLLKKEKTKRLIKKSNKIIMKIAIVLIAITLGMTFCVEANRIKFLNFVLEYTNKYTEINYNDDISDNNQISEEETQEKGFRLKYIPENFMLKRKNVTNSSIYMEFEKDDKNFIISVYEKSGSTRIDTENAEVTTIDISGRKCMFIKKNSTIRVHWSNDNMVYFMAGNIDEQEIINIIKNIKED